MISVLYSGSDRYYSVTSGVAATSDLRRDAVLRCSNCDNANSVSSSFCAKCGFSITVPQNYERAAVQNVPFQPLPSPIHHASRGFGQIFGIDPRIAFLTFLVDLMLFGTGAVTMGVATLFLSLPAGLILSFIAYRAQMKWYGDDRETAIIKAAMLGLLTALPVPIPKLVYLPSGVIGFFHNALARKTDKQLSS